MVGRVRVKTVLHRLFPETAAEWVRVMAGLRDEKPRPVNKLYGPSPTAEQLAEHRARMQVWNRRYSAARREWRAQLAREQG